MARTHNGPAPLQTVSGVSIYPTEFGTNVILVRNSDGAVLGQAGSQAAAAASIASFNSSGTIEPRSKGY